VRYFDDKSASARAEMRLNEKREGEEENERLDWKKTVPPPSVLAAFIVGGIIVRWSERAYGLAGWKEKAIHVAVGAACFLTCAAVCAIRERSTLLNVFAIVRRRKEE